MLWKASPGAILPSWFWRSYSKFFQELFLFHLLCCVPGKFLFCLFVCFCFYETMNCRTVFPRLSQNSWDQLVHCFTVLWLPAGSVGIFVQSAITLQFHVLPSALWGSQHTSTERTKVSRVFAQCAVLRLSTSLVSREMLIFQYSIKCFSEEGWLSNPFQMSHWL